MDALLVHGQGGNGQIKFGNISPGSDSFLMFELSERHLKDCDSKFFLFLIYWWNIYMLIKTNISLK